MTPGYLGGRHAAEYVEPVSWEDEIYSTRSHYIQLHIHICKLHDEFGSIYTGSLCAAPRTAKPRRPHKILNVGGITTEIIGNA